MNAEDFQKISSQIHRFTTHAAAVSFAERATKLHLALLGDDGEYWVTTPAIAEKLVQAGYEYAPEFKKTRFVAYNPLTRRFAEVDPEDEVIGSQIIELNWSDGLGKWVSTP